MCSPDKRYRSIDISAGVLTYNARRLEETNRIASVGADFSLELSNIKNGSRHSLILYKTTAADVVITTDAADFVLAQGLGAAITLSGAINTRYELILTNDGTVNCIQIFALGSSVPDELLKASATLSTTLRQVSDNAGNNSQQYLATDKSAYSGRLSIGQSSNPTAVVDIKGEGSTSATSSMLIKTNTGAQVLKVTDDGKTSFGSSGQGYFNSQGRLFCDFLYRNSGSNSYFGWQSDTEIHLRFNNSIGSIISLNGYVFGGSSLEASAILQSNATTKGWLMPRLTTAQKNAIAAPANGLMIYDTDLGAPCFYRGADAAWKTISYT